jgi:predicted ferric reductase
MMMMMIIIIIIIIIILHCYMLDTARSEFCSLGVHVKLLAFRAVVIVAGCVQLIKLTRCSKKFCVSGENTVNGEDPDAHHSTLSQSSKEVRQD